MIVTGHSDGSAAIWDSTSGAKLRSLKGHAAAVNHVQFDRGGERVITAGADGTVRFWDARTGRRTKTLGPIGSPPLTTALNSDGRLLAATHQDKSTSLWEVASRRLIARVGGPHQPALDPVFDNAENTLRTAGASDGSICLWDCATGALRRQENGDVEPSSIYSAWTWQGRFFIATGS